MIKGQLPIIESIDKMYQPPAFTILVGAAGSGRKTLVRYMSEKLDLETVPIGNKVDDIRDMIEMSSSAALSRLYVITEGDSMSIAAKNSLLKITEEPPKNCHIILLIKSLESTLPTLESRAQVFKLCPYSLDDMVHFTRNLIEVDEEQAAEYAALATNCGELERLVDVGIEEILELVKFVCDNIFEVSRSNALNLTKYLKLKKTDDSKITPDIFLKCLINFISVTIGQEGAVDYFNWSDVDRFSQLLIESSNALHKLDGSGANAAMVMNKWILDVTK